MQTKEARDWWYDVVKKRYGLIENEQETGKNIKDIKSGIERIESLVKEVTAQFEDGDLEGTKKSLNNISTTASFTSGEIATATYIAKGVASQMTCWKCGTIIGFYVSSSEITKCPNCGTEIQFSKNQGSF